MMHRIERTFAGRPLIIETGRMAKQAAGNAAGHRAQPAALALAGFLAYRADDAAIDLAVVGDGG